MTTCCVCGAVGIGVRVHPDDSDKLWAVPKEYCNECFDESERRLQPSAPYPRNPYVPPVGTHTKLDDIARQSGCQVSLIWNIAKAVYAVGLRDAVEQGQCSPARALDIALSRGIYVRGAMAELTALRAQAGHYFYGEGPFGE